MSDPLCGPCQDEGRLVKAAYLSHPPTCAEHYAKIAKPGTAAAGGGNTVLAHLFSLRKANKDKLRERVTSEASGERPCEPCLEGGDRTKATHRMNDMDMCVTHANAARIESGPPQALKPDDVQVSEEKPSKEKTVRTNSIDQDTIDAIRKLAKEGKKPQAISLELNVSWPSAKKYSEGYFVPQNGQGAR